MNKTFIISLLGALIVKPSIAASIPGGIAIVTPVASLVDSNATTAAATTPVATAPTLSNAPVVTKAPDNVTLPSSNNLNISLGDFLKAWANVRPILSDKDDIPVPTVEQYKNFINMAASKGGITSKTELAMFFAEVLFESVGLVYKSEIACQKDQCAGRVDPDALPGKYYYGRGYIQLTTAKNYKDASMDLFNDDRLYQDPDSVANREEYAWAVCFSYWKTKVKPALNNTYNFGTASRAISGGWECSDPNTNRAKKRYQVYQEVLRVFEPTAVPIETGCYN